jgi:hypothetical protein
MNQQGSRKKVTMTAAKTMAIAMAELHEAKAERAAINADLDVLRAQYSDLGKKAQAAGPVVEKTAILREQQKVMEAQTPFVMALQKAEARIQAAKAAVAKAAEIEA